MIATLQPREVSATDAWLVVIVAGDGSPVDGLSIEGGPAPIPLPGPWAPVTTQSPTICWQQRVQLTGLQPGTAYTLRLAQAGQGLADAVVTTLPERLPEAPQDPFVMVFASCFAVAQDPAGACGRAFLNLPPGMHPAFTVLCGDQVYLDTPTSHFVLHIHSPQLLAAELTVNYTQTFTQAACDGGFARLLATGGSFLTPDDHELWNNAPTMGALVSDTWTEGGREQWKGFATQLFDAFQTPERGASLEIPPLSIRICDTRLSRTMARTIFMDPARLTEIADWLAALEGPGMLVVGQPILADAAGWKGNLFDWSLVDFQQYGDLARALASVRHDVLVLTGDVHFGRWAVATLPNGARIVEIIASPMALVDPVVKGKWNAAPPVFPAIPVPGMVSSPVVTGDLNLTDNHLATLELLAIGAQVQVTHRSWIIGDGSQPQAVAGFTGQLS